ncbi:MAG: molybdopterin-dependent oxidoreductase [Acidimicrobiia bacterium]
MPQAVTRRTYAAIAGAAAAAVALAVGDMATRLDRRGPTLVNAVGSRFIDLYAARLKTLAVRLFGTHDKTALIIGIIVVCIGLGALAGLAGRARRRYADAVFVAFALVGWLAFRSTPRSNALVGALACGLAAFAGAVVIRRLLAVAPSTSDVLAVDDGVAVGTAIHRAPVARLETGMAGGSRRRFLVSAGGITLGAFGAARLTRSVRSPAGASVPDDAALPTVAPSARTDTGIDKAADIDGISAWLTPNDRFYRIDTALAVPGVDASRWSLEVKGMVDRPFSLSYADLLALEAVEETVTLQCVSNEVGGNLVGNATWTGVPLRALLDRAGVQAGAAQIVGRSVDGFTAGFPLDALTGDRVALVAFAMNGERLPTAHGFPARLVVAGLYGYVSATKWLRSIELTTWDGFDGYWISRGWSKNGPIKTASRIDVPRAGATLDAGPNPIAGVAWAPTRGISAVEVQVDSSPWMRATIGSVGTKNTWVQWWLDWDAPAGGHTIRVRAIDGTGAVQTGEVHSPDPDGATGWHSRKVQVRRS